MLMTEQSTKRMDVLGSSTQSPFFVNPLQQTATSQLSSMLPQLSAATGQMSNQIGSQIGGHSQLGTQLVPGMTGSSPFSLVSPTDLLRMNIQQDPQAVLSAAAGAPSNKNLLAAAAAGMAANQQMQKQAVVAHQQQQAAAAQKLLQAAAAAPTSHQLMNHHLAPGIQSVLSNPQSLLMAQAPGNPTAMPNATTAALSAALQQQYQNQFLSSQLPLLNLSSQLGSLGGVGRNGTDSRNPLIAAEMVRGGNPNGVGGVMNKPLKSVSGSQYIDYAKHPGANDPVGTKGARDASFPVKLYRMLEDEEFSKYISWMPHGRAWKVLRQDEFEEKVIPLYFRHARFASFMRQVNGWGFRRVSDGLDRNSYYHEMFLRGFPHLCAKMRRPTESVRNSTEPRLHPNFYDVNKFLPLPALPPKSSKSSTLTDNNNNNNSTTTASTGSIPHTVSQSSCSDATTDGTISSSPGLEQTEDEINNEDAHQFSTDENDNFCNDSNIQTTSLTPISTNSTKLLEDE